METADQVRFIVEAEIKRCQSILRANNFLAPNPKVTYDLKGRCLGLAYGDQSIRVNLPVAMELGAAYAETAGHEYAHIFVYRLATTQPDHPFLQGDVKGGHGKAWKAAMALFNLAPERLVGVELARKLATKGTFGDLHSYKCSCGPIHSFSSRRHNNVTVRGRTYQCLTCKSIIVKA